MFSAAWRSMLIKSIVLALRQLQKNPATSAFNIAGLAVGITSFSLLLFYIQKEKSYDRHHAAIDQLYRLVSSYRVEKDHNTTAWVPPAIAENVEGLAEAVRMYRYRSPVVMIDRTNNRNFTERNSIWADANIFQIFSFDFVKGNPDDALTRPNTMVITESTAARYFGDVDPIGKVLSDITMNADFEITGVVRDTPPTSHFSVDFLCSLSTLPNLWGEQTLHNWNNNFLYTYLRAPEGTSKSDLENAINEVAAKNIQSSEQYSVRFLLQPVADIHLGSNVQHEWQPNSDIRYVYILTAVAALIILVSAINYINLWIARSERRMKEIGIRRAIGGSKGNLRTQFTIESLTHVVLALALSATLVSVIGPMIKRILGEDIIPQSQLAMWMYIFGGMIGFMFVVMLYPARIISKIRPALAIKGRQRKSKGVTLWEGLIAFQILTTACLITGTLLINRQLSFMKDQPLGYDADHLVNVSQMSNIPLRNRLKEAFEKDSRVKSTSGVSHLLGETLYMTGYRIFNNGAVENVLWQRIHTDYDFCSTYQIPIVAGRDFSRTVASDSSNFIINETAARLLGVTPESAVGLEVNGGLPANGKIVGVMKDFHFKTLHSGIEPLIIHIVPQRIRMLTVNIGGSDVGETLRWMEDQWKQLQPEEPFVYTTLAGENDQRYRFEEKFAKVIVFFTTIVFLLSVSGLVSLNIYIANLRRREIGIRKILGAETSDVLLTLSKRFAVITLVGFAMSVPLSWYALDAWLHGFAYKVDLTAGLFIAGGVITFVLSMLSISLPSWRAASEKAVSVLRAGE